MSTSTHISRIVLLLALLALPTVVAAQQTGTTTTEQPTLADRFEMSFARMTIEFWTPKLNRYRAEIDRMLAASDLVEVNELRTRAALLLERIQAIEKKRKARQHESTTDTAMITSDMVTDTTSTYAVTTDTVIFRDEMSEGSEGELVEGEQSEAAAETDWEREYERER